MNKLLRPICYCVLLAGLLASRALGQDGNDLGGLPVARPFQAGVGFPAPGRVWIGGNAAHNGLGYRGSYFTGGFVADLGEDGLDGFWVLDSRAHISQQGNLMGNFGFVRGLKFEQLNADLRVGGFYDIDGDKADNFGHTFHQLGITGEFLNDFFELRANGYFPIATTDFQLATSGDCFIGNNLLVQNGVDSALTGFDLRAGFRPAWAQPWAGVIDVGGYYYRSDIVDPFGGFTGGFSVQPINGLTGIFQINHDEQFKTTGLLALQVHVGGSRGRGVSRVANEAEPVRRNEHIVRVHQDPIFASNPATGVLYNVIHVDNSAPDGGDGTVERPFNELVEAETASAPNDIIFVREGLTPGDLTGMDTGITLKDGQFFLGDGVQHLIPTIEVGLFELCNDIDGNRPTITNNVLFNPAVTLANDNVVAGFNIGNAANPATFGIQGTGTNNVFIRDNVISNSLVDGVRITGGTGVFNFSQNTIANSAADGIHIIDSEATVNISSSTFTANGVGGLAGVHIEKAAGAAQVVNITTSTFDGNGTGILSEVSGGVNVFLTTNIFDNLAINNSLANGIEVSSAGGADHTVLIDGNLAINGNGTAGAGGQGIVVRVLDGGADTSILRATITDNIFDSNVGAGATGGSDLLVAVTGNSRTPTILIDGNSFTGGAAANAASGLRFIYNVTTTNAPDSIITISNNTLANVTTEEGAQFDVSGATRLGVIVNANTVTGGGGAIDGFLLIGTDTSVSHFQFTQNVITGIGSDGIHASVAGGGPTMILEVVGNVLNNNGLNGVLLELGQILFVPVPNSDADMFTFLRNNTITPNAGADDVTGTIEATALITSELCLQMTNNNAANGILLTNNSVLATFNFENGGNNIPAVPATAGAGSVTNVAPGTCAAGAGPLAILPLLP